MSNSKIQNLILFSLFSFLFSSFASAQVPEFKGEEVVVTALRYPQFKSEIPWSITVLGSRELQGTKNLGEALRPAVSTDIKSVGYDGGVTSARLRGGAAEHVLVLVDGMRVASPLLGVADATNIASENIEKVEIVRGPSSPLYGSEAIDGVINVITKGPSPTPEAEAGILYGTYNTQQISFLSWDRNYQFSGSLDKTDGFRENSASEQQNYSGRFSFNLGKLESLDFGLGFYTAIKCLPNVPTAESQPYSASTPEDRQKDRNAYYNVKYKRQLGNDSYFEVRSYQTQQVQNTHLYDFNASKFVDSDYISFINGVELQHVIRLHTNNMLTYGMDFRDEKGDSFYAGRHSINNSALYMQDEINPIENLNVLLGARVDKHIKSGDFLSPRAGILYKPQSDLGIRVSYGSSFRSPTLNEFYWNDPVWLMYGDPNLKPEKAAALEAGIHKEIANSLSFDLSYFTNTVTDMIIWQYDPSTFTTTASNIDSAQVEGLELEVRHSLEDWLKFSFNTALQRSVRIYDKDPSLVGKDLPYSPRAKENIGISFGDEENLLLNVMGRYVGERYHDASNTYRLPSYVVLDVKLSKRTHGTTYYLKIENAADSEYYESAGYHPITWVIMKYPMPGRRISFGVSIKI